MDESHAVYQQHSTAGDSHALVSTSDCTGPVARSVVDYSLGMRSYCQVKSAEALAAELEAFLWPTGTTAQVQAGRVWESLESATEEIKQFMQTQGCSGLKIKNQTYFDAARSRVKKRVFKCPCSGVHTPRTVQSIAVGRQTSTKKTNCGVYINVNVDAHSGEWLSGVDCCQRLWFSLVTLCLDFCS